MLLLIGATGGCVPLFLACAGIVICSGLSEPRSFPGNPNIGGGLLLLVAVFGVPFLVGWGLWLAARL